MSEQELALTIKTTWKYLCTIRGPLSGTPYSVWESPSGKLRIQIHDVDNEVVALQKVETDEWFITLRDILRFIDMVKDA